MTSMLSTPDATFPVGAKVVDPRATWKHGTVLAVLDDGTIRVRWEWETRCAKLCVREESRENLVLAGTLGARNGSL